MKAILLNPPPIDSKLITDSSVSREIGISSFEYIYPPLGLMYLGSILEREGHDSEIFDGNVNVVSFQKLVRYINRKSPDMLAIQMPPVLYEHYSKLREEVDRKTVIVHMGPFPTINPEMSLNSGADYVIRGEPELTITNLMDALGSGGDVSRVKGISYRRNGKVVHNDDAGLIKDLDDLPFPARHKINNRKYFIPFANEPFTSIITSRGCPHRCIFCTTRIYFGRTLRLRSIENVIEEIKECVEKHKINHICFWDDTFNVNINRAKELCRRIIEEGLRIRWFCLSRVDKVDYELLKLMKESGCYNIQFGVESASQKILDNIKKDITISQIEYAFKASKVLGIETTAFFMIGNPGETRETIEKTIEFSRKLDPDYARFCLATPFPGTEFYENEKCGEQDWSKSDILHSTDTEFIKGEEIEAYLRKAYRSFYFRPRFIVREMMKVRNLSSLKYKSKQAIWLMRNTLGNG
jgi:anaerobic magnesium-protoporphyrin IX monomethyl ester cyclase